MTNNKDMYYRLELSGDGGSINNICEMFKNTLCEAARLAEDGNWEPLDTTVNMGMHYQVKIYLKGNEEGEE